ncbi:hypothetical protein G4H71_17365 [Rhodococcus triatomae]|uniref:Antibiotic biosynthesis monooxygenase n=1 Tax=Rhodococcus triatomae TaxID=300028 RepID=A0A1G8FKM2_9NOCA|nr:hypothetical protein [Rhodococcus triatomae]QNG19510.1 hypothetical protein G4H72_13010 [Rhodococcus triatomae]QNG24575.1 hypothetical protein G4H71_17365 [Rhodococcus triatomae]SDH82703.1 hypothetical protein SAMN05444695_103315 [Rhodococcus triatomae]
MPPTIEYVRFDASDPDLLLAGRESLIEVLRERYGSDFLGAHLARTDDGSLMDFLIWSSPEAAARAAEEMPRHERTQGFFRQIGHVHEMRHGAVLHTA